MDKMENYFDAIPDELSRWDFLDQELEISSDEESKKTENKAPPNNQPTQTVHNLQRDYVSLYGCHPKMENRTYSTCGVCEQVFNPNTVATHKQNCPGKGGRVQLQHLKKKGKSKKRAHSSSVPMPPLFKKEPPVSTPPVLPKQPEVQVGRDMPLLTVDSDLNVNVTVSTSRVAQEAMSAPPRLSPAAKSSPPVHLQPPVLFPNPRSPPPPVTAEVELLPAMPGSTSTHIVSSSSSNSSSNKHKKSKKSSKTLREYDPDVHCGVIEGQRGPCTRSITCSNHKIQLRKSVPGRSKDIHLLIAERKAAKEKESRPRSPPTTAAVATRPTATAAATAAPAAIATKEPTNSPKEYVIPLAKSPPITCDLPQENANEISNFIAAVVGGGSVGPPPPPPPLLTAPTQAPARVPPLPDLSENDLHDETETDDSANQLKNGYYCIETAVSTTKSSPVIYYNPISPIFVVTPIQFVQKENNLYVETPPPHQPVVSPSLPNGSYFLTMPDQTSSSIKIYKSHPKPAVLPSYGVRKVGGAILSSNQRLEYQRNDIQMAINTKRKATSSTSCKNTTTTYNVPPQQRSILLKTKGINNNKVNCKRTSTDKSNGSSDSKQIKLSGDVNGFILHADVSEVAEAPHATNNCIQENINLLNMK